VARTFNGTTDVLGFTPRAFPAWVGITVASLWRLNAASNFRTFYYAGASGGSVDGNIQLGINNLNDPYFGTNTAAARTLAATFTATNSVLVCTKATGTATPTANYSITPPFTTWTHGNMSGTLADPATAATTIEEVGRWNGASDFFVGDIDWVGVWNYGVMSANETESLHHLAPRFLPHMLPGCVRFWRFNQPISDTVRDESNSMADQTSRSGTTHTNEVPLMPNLAGTTFSVVPGVL
jgi:hypothetical protein